MTWLIKRLPFFHSSKNLYFNIERKCLQSRLDRVVQDSIILLTYTSIVEWKYFNANFEREYDFINSYLKHHPSISIL